MATLKLGSTTVMTESSGVISDIPAAGVTGTLPNAVQDNVTRLGTVTAGNVDAASTGLVQTFSGTATSGASSHTFNLAFTTDYDNYLIQCFRGNGSGQWRMRFTDSGNSVIDDNNYWYHGFGRYVSSANNGYEMAQGYGQDHFQVTDGSNTSAAYGCDLWFWLRGPTDSTKYKNFHGAMTYWDGSSYWEYREEAMCLQSTAVINGINLYTSSGDSTWGSVTCHGLKK